MGDVACVLRQEERADLVFCAELSVDICLVADSFLDLESFISSNGLDAGNLVPQGLPYPRGFDTPRSNPHHSIQR